MSKAKKVFLRIFSVTGLLLAALWILLTPRGVTVSGNRIGRAWGPLPHAPVHKLGDPPGLPPFRESFLADPAYQSELDRVSRSELTRNSDVRLYQNGEALAPMKALVLHAQKYLFIQMLAISCDSSTEGLMLAIETRARQGVDVRLLVHRTYAMLSRSCLARLRRAGVDVVTAKTHASYLISDQDELLVGSESMARMFFESTGFNSLDRDMMLWIHGPAATEALRDFLAVWEKNRSAGDRDILKQISTYKAKVAAEARAGSRGVEHYPGWLSAEPRGLCRFTADPELLLSLARNVKQRITFSGVKTGALPAIEQALQRSRAGRLKVDFIGNGWEGGNGELTMVLNEFIQQQLSAGRPRIARAWELLRDADMESQARQRFASYRRMAAEGPLTIWAFFNFLHYKIWAFDQYGVWVGSANPVEEAFANFHEAGAFCLDTGLARELGVQLDLDRVNSVSISEK